MITIDGPSGVGKTAVAHLLATRFGLPYMSIGLLYRALALAQRGGATIGEAAAAISIHDAREGCEVGIRLGGRDVTRRLYGDPALEAAVARVASDRDARARVAEIVRSWVGKRDAVLEGRTAHTFAGERGVSFFLWASADERARRTLTELTRRGVQADLGDVAASIRRRDEHDRTRAEEPLRLHDSMLFVDSTAEPSVEGTVGILESLARHRRGEHPWRAAVVVPSGRPFRALPQQDLEADRYDVVDRAVAAEANADVLVFVDPDRAIGPSFVRRHLEAHSRVTPLILAGACPTPLGRDVREVVLDRSSGNVDRLRRPWELGDRANLSLSLRIVHAFGGDADASDRDWVDFVRRCCSAGVRIGYRRDIAAVGPPVRRVGLALPGRAVRFFPHLIGEQMDNVVQLAAEEV